jgi:hypothetical protein
MKQEEALDVIRILDPAKKKSVQQKTRGDEKNFSL